METKSIRISEKGYAALDRLAVFSPDKTRIQVLEDALVAQAKLCKGKPPKPAKAEVSKKPAKKAGTGANKSAKGVKPVHR